MTTVAITHKQAMVLLRRAEDILYWLIQERGAIVRPVKEDMEELLGIMIALKEHEQHGMRSNPRRHKRNPLVVYGNPPRGSVVISHNVHQLKYTHAENDEDFVHDFESSDVELLGLPNGTVLLSGRSGQQLWEDM